MAGKGASAPAAAPRAAAPAAAPRAAAAVAASKASVASRTTSSNKPSSSAPRSNVGTKTGTSTGTSKQTGAPGKTTQTSGGKTGGTKTGGSTGGSKTGGTKTGGSKTGGKGGGKTGGKGGGSINITGLPDFAGIFDDIMGVIGSGQSDYFNELEGQYQLDEQMLKNKSQEQLGEFNLQGVLAQAEAQKYASEQAAGATRFAATESTRGQIESTRLGTESAERQIGLTGEQERRTQAERMAGEERQIGLRGTEERATQRELLAGQERQIGLTGEQQRLLAQTQGREQRDTELQQEMFRRYKEQKDQSDAMRAFRA